MPEKASYSTVRFLDQKLSSGDHPRTTGDSQSAFEKTRQLQLATNSVISWVFHRDGKPIKDYYGGWDKACRLSGNPDRVAHDLRRTAVRNLERAGMLDLLQ